jgi:hypothetical protein
MGVSVDTFEVIKNNMGCILKGGVRTHIYVFERENKGMKCLIE